MSFTTVAQNRYAELITVESAIETVGYVPYELSDSSEPTPNNYKYLKLQRYLFDRVMYSKLTPQQMLWERSYNASEYYTFIFRNNDLDYTPYTYDCINCGLNGPTIVAIKKGTTEYKQYVLNAINRNGILKQRL